MKSDKNIKMDVIFYSELIRLSTFERAMELFKEMKENNIKPNNITLNNIFQIFKMNKRYDIVLEFKNEMEKESYELDLFHYVTILSCLAYSKNVSIIESYN
eukprot:UN24350